MEAFCTPEIFILILRELYVLMTIGRFQVAADVKHGVPCTSKDVASSEPCLLEQDALRFAVMGDWGKYKDGSSFVAHRDELAGLLGSLHAELHFDFILNVGDNIYNEGVVGEDTLMSQFEEAFQKPYPQSSVDVVWYSMLGNHDYRGKENLEIEYTNKDPSQRWVLPSLYYTFSYNIRHPSDDTTTLVRFIVVDESICTGEFPDARDDTALAEEQKSWLTTQLENANDADYIIVTAHRTVYSLRDERDSKDASSCRVAVLGPDALASYGVTAYISGHDHNLQHIPVKSADSTMHYFISGEGSEFHYITDGDLEKTQHNKDDAFYHPHHDSTPTDVPADYNNVADDRKRDSDRKREESTKPGLLHIAVAHAKAEFTFVDANNQVLHSVELPSRKTSA